VSAASGALLNSTLLVLTGPWPLVVVYVVCRNTPWLSKVYWSLNPNCQTGLTLVESSLCALKLVHRSVHASGGDERVLRIMLLEQCMIRRAGDAQSRRGRRGHLYSGWGAHEVVGDGEAHVEGEAEDEDVARRVLVRVLHLAQADRRDQAEHDAEQARHHGLRQRREQAAELACAAGTQRCHALPVTMQPVPLTTHADRGPVTQQLGVPMTDSLAFAAFAECSSAPRLRAAPCRPDYDPQAQLE